MLNLKGVIARIRQSQNEKGQGLVEYALILVLVAIVVIAVLLTLGPTVAGVYCQVANALQPGSCTAAAGPAVAGPYIFGTNHPPTVAAACAALGASQGDLAYSFATHEPPDNGDDVYWSTSSTAPVSGLQASGDNPRTCP